MNAFEVLCEGETLVFRKPRDDKFWGITLVLNDEKAEYKLKSFSPRLSSSGIVSEVEVRGWDATKKEEIVYRASAGKSPLGSTGAASASSAFGQKVSFDVDHPSFSLGEAKTKAEALLRESLMGYITGNGVAFGYKDLRAGLIVEIELNTSQDDKFNGRYLVTGAQHRYAHTRGGGGGGYITEFRFKRDAEGK
jgi:hypothetical protein